MSRLWLSGRAPRGAGTSPERDPRRGLEAPADGAVEGFAHRNDGREAHQASRSTGAQVRQVAQRPGTVREAGEAEPLEADRFAQRDR